MSGIYIHIPFCKSHCTYCGFYSELLRSAQGSESFVSALCSEIRAAQNDALRTGHLHQAETLYIGGGTPSVLSLQELSGIIGALPVEILGGIREFTIEVNPDDILKGGASYIAGLRKFGVNRVSMGVQSFDDAVLRRMGRRHNTAEAVQAYTLLREGGMSNLSVDLIFGFTLDWSISEIRAGLEALPALPEHISCYQLSIESGSGLEKMIEKGLYSMPSDEQCEKQYYELCTLLRELGYDHYEISNWAKPLFRSRHNSSYWNHTPYLGFGPGAHSLLIHQGVMQRCWNKPDLRVYLEAWKDAGSDEDAVAASRESETLTPEQIHDERVMLGLRTVEGVDGMSIPEEKWFISDSIILDKL